MYCKACGKYIPDDSVFCSYCGMEQDEVSDKFEDPIENTKETTGKKLQKKVICIAKGIAVPVFDASVQIAAETVQKKMFKGTDKMLKKVGLKEKTFSERMVEGAKKGISKVNIKKAEKEAGKSIKILDMVKRKR